MVKGHIISLIIKNITIIKIRSDTSFISLMQLMQILVAGYVIFGSLRVLFIFSGNIFRCSSNIKLESSIRPRFFWDDDWEPLVVLNTNGGWFFFCFATENDFMSLFSRVWIKVHFPLKGPVIYYFQIITEIICRCLNVTYNKKQRSIKLKKALHWQWGLL